MFSSSLFSTVSLTFINNLPLLYGLYHSSHIGVSMMNGTQKTIELITDEHGQIQNVNIHDERSSVNSSADMRPDIFLNQKLIVHASDVADSLHRGYSIDLVPQGDGTYTLHAGEIKHNVFYSYIETGDGTTRHFLTPVESLSNSQKKAEILEQMIHAMFHDVRNPILIIKGRAQILQTTADKNADPDYLNNISSIINAADKLAQISFAYSDSMGDAPIMIDSYDPSELLQQVIRAYLTDPDPETSEMNRTYNIKLNSFSRKLIIKDTLPEFVLTDQKRLYAILENIITNALKFSKQTIEIGGTTYSSGSDGEMDVIYIKDDGAGILPENISEIFGFRKSFDNVPNNESGQSRAGSGIGLFSAHKFAQQIGVKLWAESEYGKGATFYIGFKKETAYE